LARVRPDGVSQRRDLRFLGIPGREHPLEERLVEFTGQGIPDESLEHLLEFVDAHLVERRLLCSDRPNRATSSSCSSTEMVAVSRFSDHVR
jgi:hypothetical protein